MKTHYFKNSARPLVLGSALVGTMIIVICSLFYIRLSRTINSELDSHLYEVANSISSNVNFRIETTFRTLESIGETAFQLRQNKELAHAFLKSKAEAYGFDRISVMDLEGNALFSNDQTESLYGHPRLSAALLEGKRQFARFVESLVDGSDGVLYANPIYNNGKILGVIAAWNRFDHLRDALQLPHFGGEGFSFLSDSQGNIIMSAIHKNVPSGVRNFFDLITNRGSVIHGTLDRMRSDMRVSEKGSLDFELDGGPAITLRYVPLEQQGLYLFSVVPRKTACEKITYLMHEMLFLNIAIIALFLSLISLVYSLYRSHSKKLEQIAFVDPVTGGYTRARFDIEAQKKIREAPPSTYAFLSLNVEKFKLVNHTFGIEAGDKILKDIYDNILSCMNEGELLCRNYADEFTLLIKFESKDKIIKDVELFTKKINEFSHSMLKRYYLRVSLGVYRIDNPFISIIDMQDRASLARKSNKAVIKGDMYSCVFYSDIERLQMIKLKEIENKMKEALENEDFMVYLQPKVSLDDNKIAGAEALVRWNDKDNGLIPPNDFIPFFEANGFICKLDLYVFEKTCALIRKWINSGVTPVPVSVNLSRAHLFNPDFISKYVEIRDRYNIPHDLLELELTESLDFENMEVLITIVNQLHQAGFKCSLDDFGRGYSSLNTLKNINVDTLKLDSSFWQSPNADNKKERDIIRALVELAKKLNMKTVSEGVETIAQVEFLKTIQCDMIQGFVFSKPVPPAEFEEIAYGKEIQALDKLATDAGAAIELTP